MFRSRRAWLLFPLLVLTLFFAACGWHTWQMFMERDEMVEDGVTMAASRYALSHIPRSTTVYVKWSAGFSSPRVQNFILTQHKKVRVLPEAESFPEGAANLGVEIPESGITNHINVGCYVSWSTRSSGQVEGLRLRRSPLRFWDSSWHITDTVEQNSDLFELPALSIFP